MGRRDDDDEEEDEGEINKYINYEVFDKVELNNQK